MPTPLAALDGTGIESRHTSRYYAGRRSPTGDETQGTAYTEYLEGYPGERPSEPVGAGRRTGSVLRRFKAAFKGAAWLRGR